MMNLDQRSTHYSSRLRAFARALPARGLLPLLVIAGLLSTPPLRAASPVTLENARVIAPQRFGGPLYLTGELQYHGEEIISGQFLFRIGLHGAIVTQLVSEPTALAPGLTRFRKILPVLPAPGLAGSLANVEVRFRTKTDTYLLRELPVRLAAEGSQPFVLLQIRSATDFPETLNLLREPLSLAHIPQKMLSKGTTFASPTLTAEELPEQSLAYCAFDGVAITARGFQELTARQMKALVQWVRAGGTLCIRLLRERTYARKHAEFLNTVFQDSQFPPWRLDEKGHLLGEGTNLALLATPTGLGFIIIAWKPPSWDSRAWREAYGQFWHLPQPVAEAIAEKNAQEPVPGGPSPARRALMIAQSSLSNYTPPIGRKIVEQLRPEDVRILPAWALISILGFYILLVGPIDYWLLGWFKKRRWTWLTFPVVTIALTLGLVAVANALMSASMKSRSVTIVDCDANGEPVRINRLKFYFENVTQYDEHRQNATTFSRLHPAYFHAGPSMVGGARRRLPQGMSSIDAGGSAMIKNDAPTGPYRGIFPGRYTVAQWIGKWTPQVNRTMTFATDNTNNPSNKIPAIDWQAAADPDTHSLILPDGRLARVLHIAGDDLEPEPEQSPPGMPPAGQSVQPAGGMGMAPAGQAFPPASGAAMGMGMGTIAGRMVATPQPDAQIRAALMDRLGSTYQELGKLITLRAPGPIGRSPLGLGRLEDLALVDPFDPKSRAIVIKVQEPDGSMTFYRKLDRKPYVPGAPAGKTESEFQSVDGGS